MTCSILCNYILLDAGEEGGVGGGTAAIFDQFD
jgi:hypothetical protein